MFSVSEIIPWYQVIFQFMVIFIIVQQEIWSKFQKLPKQVRQAKIDYSCKLSSTKSGDGLQFCREIKLVFQNTN